MKQADTLKSCLDSLADSYGGDYLDSDPVGLVHDFSAMGDIEVAAFIASALAYGGAKQIRKSVRDALDRLDKSPSSCVMESSGRELRQRFKGFKHRWTDGDDMAYVLRKIGEIIMEHGSIGRFVESIDRPGDGTIERTLSLFSSRIVDSYQSEAGIKNTRNGISYLVPSPIKGSACKRMAMYFRWMVRGPDDVDFGLWSFIHPSRLIIPVDSHIARMGTLLGLTERKSPDWKMALEITAALKTLDANDPLRYDFALVRPGILGECSKSSKGDCSNCVLQTVCLDAE